MQVVAVDRLAGSRLRPVTPADRAERRFASPARRCRGATPDAGRAAVLAALYPPSHALRRLSDDGTAALEAIDDAGAGRRRLARAGAGADRQPRQPARDGGDQRPPACARRLSVGPEADPPDPAPVPARGGLRDDRRDRARHAGRPGRGARRPAPPGDPPRAVRGRGGGIRPDRRLSVHRRQDRAPPSRTSSATSRSTGSSRCSRNWETHQGRRARRAGQGAHRRLRWHCPRAAGAAGQPRDPGARIGPGLGLGRDLGACGRRWGRSSRSCVSAATDEERLHELGDVLFALVNLGALDEDRSGGGAARGEPPLARPLPSASSASPPSGASTSRRSRWPRRTSSGTRSRAVREACGDRRPRHLPRRPEGPPPERRPDRCRPRGRRLRPAAAGRGGGRDRRRPCGSFGSR